jgi:hypothetical protein
MSHSVIYILIIDDNSNKINITWDNEVITIPDFRERLNNTKFILALNIECMNGYLTRGQLDILFGLDKKYDIEIFNLAFVGLPIKHSVKERFAKTHITTCSNLFSEYVELDPYDFAPSMVKHNPSDCNGLLEYNIDEEFYDFYEYCTELERLLENNSFSGVDLTIPELNYDQLEHLLGILSGKKLILVILYYFSKGREEEKTKMLLNFMKNENLAVFKVQDDGYDVMFYSEEFFNAVENNYSIKYLYLTGLVLPHYIYIRNKQIEFESRFKSAKAIMN